MDKPEKTIKRIEDQDTRLLNIIILLSGIIFIRSIIEIYLGQITPIISLENIRHFYVFYISAFLSSVILISYLSRQRVHKVCNVILFGYTSIIVAPILDYFILKKFSYTYLFDQSLPLNTPNWDLLKWSYLMFFSNTNHATVGQKIEIILLMILATIYIFYKTRSIIRTFVTPLLVYTLTFFYASFPNYFKFFNQKNIFGFWHNYLYEDTYYTSVLTILIVIQCVMLFYLYDKNKFICVIKNLVSGRSLHYIAMVGFGAYLSNQVMYTQFLAFMCVLLLWQAAISINDVYDVRGDELSKRNSPLVTGKLDAVELKGMALACSLLSLIISTTLSYSAIIAIIFFTSLSAAYSIPPIRLKKYPLISSSMIAAGSLTTFIMGFYSGPTDTRFPVSLAYGIMICFTLAFNTKDLKDYEGDKADRIFTIPVLLGLERGRIVIASLNLLSYVIASVILGGRSLIPCIVFGVLTFALVLRKGMREWHIFLLYFLFLVSLLIF